MKHGAPGQDQGSGEAQLCPAVGDEGGVGWAFWFLLDPIPANPFSWLGGGGMAWEEPLPSASLSLSPSLWVFLLLSPLLIFFQLILLLPLLSAAHPAAQSSSASLSALVLLLFPWSLSPTCLLSI